MKVIFLGVDGVLNSKDDLLKYRENNTNRVVLYSEVEDRPLKLLKQLVEKTGAKIVISSSWRIGCDRSGTDSVFGTELYDKLVQRLKDYDMEVFDITPLLSGINQRENEICQWLQKHDGEVEEFVIIDNEKDIHGLIESNLVETTYEHGLTEEHITRAIQLLGGAI